MDTQKVISLLERLNEEMGRPQEKLNESDDIDSYTLKRIDGLMEQVNIKRYTMGGTGVPCPACNGTGRSQN